MRGGMGLYASLRASAAQMSTTHRLPVPPPCNLQSVWWATEYSPVYARPQWVKFLRTQHWTMYSASQEEALRSRRARLSTHPHEVWPSRATKLSTLQPQVVSVVSGPPVPSDTTTWGQDSGLGSKHPINTQIFSSTSLLCLLHLEHLFKSCGDGFHGRRRQVQDGTGSL